MATTVVYVSCAEPREILRFAMDRDSGALQRIDATYVPGIDIASNTSMPLAVSPDRRVLHAGLRQPPYPCVGFAIDPADGALRVLGGANLPHSVCYLTIDRTGKHLLAASYQGALLASHALDARGVITAPPTQVVPTPPAAHSVIQDAAGRFVYAASLGGDVVMRLRFDAATGRLDDMQTAPMPHGRRAAASAPVAGWAVSLRAVRTGRDDRRVRGGAGDRVAGAATDPAHPTGGLRRQVRGHAPDAGRALAVCQRAADQHADRLPHRARTAR